MCRHVIIKSIIILNAIQIIIATRLPLEAYEPLSSSLQSSPSTTTATALTSTTITADGHSIQHHKLPTFNTEQQIRKSRQMVENKQPRILYQVGNSEEDLPICGQNVVCSKIDLYETPWIERQCRCPPQRPLVIYHNKNNNNNNEKPYSDDEKRYQQQRRILYLNDKNIDPNVLKQLNEILSKKDIYNVDTNTDTGIDLTNNNSQELNNDDKEQHHKQKQVQQQQHESIVSETKPNYFQHYYSIHKKDHFNEQHHLNFNNNNNHNKQLQQHEPKRFRHAAHRMDFPTIGGCPSSIDVDDGHTIADKTRHYKLCEPVHKLPMCRYFRDNTWTLKSSPDSNVTEQIVHCHCPKNSITYLIKRVPNESGQLGYTYLFACSPQSHLRCQRKEPCKLFTVRKRQEFLDEVNTNPLCQCPRNHYCPTHHMDGGVIIGKSYLEDNIRTYSGYCLPIPSVTANAH